MSYDAWATSAPESFEMSDREWERWRALLWENVDEATVALDDRMIDADEANDPDPERRDRLPTYLTAMLDDPTEAEQLARLMLSLGVLTAGQADPAAYTEDWRQGEADDAACAAADIAWSERE